MAYIGNVPSTLRYSIDSFSGDGSNRDFTLRDAPVSPASIMVFVDGSYISTQQYTLTGSNLNLTTPPSSATNNIQVIFLGITTAIGPVTDGSVTSSKIANGAISGEKLGQGAVSANNIAPSVITGDKIVDGTIGSSNLIATGVTSGDYGGLSSIPTITVDSAGRLSYAANVNSLTAFAVGDTTGPAEHVTFDVYGSFASQITDVSDGSSINVASANYFTCSPSGTTTYTFDNVPASRDVSFVIQLTNGGTQTISWPASVYWPRGATAPALTASGKDLLIFSTSNGGTTWRGCSLIGYTS